MRKALARDFLGQARSFPFPTCLQIPTASYKQYEIINKQEETNSNNSEEVNSNLAIWYLINIFIINNNDNNLFQFKHTDAITCNDLICLNIMDSVHFLSTWYRIL